MKYVDITPYLRCALWGADVEHVDADWNVVMQTAEEQAVLGIVFYGAERAMMGKVTQKQVFEWIGATEQIKVQNLQMNEELARFDRFMRKNGIDYRVVKGQIVGYSYPEPLLRQSGDIDLYFTPDHYKLCTDLLLQKGIKMDYDASEKHSVFDMNGIVYELHWTLNNFSREKWQQYFDDVLQRDKGMTVKVGDKEIPTISATVNALYIFIHLFHHLIHSGVGLRQLCDWMMWLHQYKDEIDREELKRHLQTLELERSYRVLGAILVEQLGLPENEFPLVITDKDRKRSIKIMADIMTMGNFGHNKQKTRNLGLVHSMQTGWQMVCQSAKYVDLAPQEILGRVPDMVTWWMKKKVK